MPRKEKTFTLARLHSTVKIDNEVVNVNLLILFSRPILLAELEEKTTPFFEYEFTNYTLSPFKDGMIRNGDKASLCSFLMKIIPNASISPEIVQANDGEALLFQIKSFLFTKFSDMYKLYKNIYTVNTDTAMLCLIVVEAVPPQKTCNIQIEVAKFFPTLPSHQMKNA